MNIEIVVVNAAFSTLNHFKWCSVDSLCKSTNHQNITPCSLDHDGINVCFMTGLCRGRRRTQPTRTTLADSVQTWKFTCTKTTTPTYTCTICQHIHIQLHVHIQKHVRIHNADYITLHSAEHIILNTWCTTHETKYVVPDAIYLIQYIEYMMLQTVNHDK